MTRHIPLRPFTTLAVLLTATVAFADPALPRGGVAVWIASEKQDPTRWAGELAGIHERTGRLVLGLHPNREAVAKARNELARLGTAGPIVVDHLPSGQPLPMIDNSANLLIASKGIPIAEADILRVLAPGGVAQLLGGDKAQEIRKPWPDDIDAWTHYLHDTGNNAVADDDRIGPPRHLQWQAGPRWGRHHDHLSSVSATVTSAGRVFAIIDEGSYLSPQLPADWQLVARDAFNGALLWKRPIAKWQTHLWPLKSGPANLPRRLVAVDDKVYVTLGIDAPVSVLYARTGKMIRELPDSEGTEEILVVGDTVLALVNKTPVDYAADAKVDPEESNSRDSRTTYSPEMGRIWSGIRSPRWSHGRRAILAYNRKDGRPLWQKPSEVIPLTLAADNDRVYFHNTDKVVALDISNGEEAWTSEPVPVWEGLQGQGLQSWFAPTLVVHNGTVIFAGGEKTNMSYVGYATDDIGQDTMTAFSAETGKKLWTAASPFSGYNSPEDVFVAQGKVWTGNTAKGGADGRYLSYDLKTGELVDNFPPTLDAYWFHHRCYRAKATKNYILSSRAGIEFIDLDSGQWSINHWVRGACLYGIMPANGLVYSPPHPCACYPEAKLYGFTALAAPRAESGKGKTKEVQRLQKGPACNASALQSPASSLQPGNWPTYRADASRSGATHATISAGLKPSWTTQLGGNLTQPVVADGRLFVAAKDSHLVHALDAQTGKKLWSHVSGGRIDSPPTIDGSRVLFGSADGYVTCLRSEDGQLVWRYRVAPADLRTVSFDQIESVWPVHGSVLVQDGIATVVAGRSMYLDGGLHVCRLDVETGRLLSEEIMDDRDPESEGSLQDHIKGLNMPVALTDVLSSDGERLYMRSQVMDLAGKRVKLGPANTGFHHLFTPYGFTDDSWFHRIYWVYGDGFQGGVGGYGNGKNFPAGRILVNNDDTVFGYGRKPEFYRWTSVLDYQLFAAAKPGGDSGAPRAIYFENTESLDPTQKPITVAAWIKTDRPDGTILVRGANLNGFALTLIRSQPQMLLRTKGTTHVAKASRAIGDDWTHVAGVLHADGRMEVFVNGEVAGATEGVPMLSANPSIAMKVGYDDTNQLLPKPLVPFSGTLDEVMLFHRALAPEEIQTLADPTARLTDDLRRQQVLHLAFNDGKTNDTSGLGNNGRLEDTRAITTDGPAGTALVLEQPKNLIASTRNRSGSKIAYHWTRDVPILVRAMALASDKLVIAGPADVLDEVSSFQTISDTATQKLLAKQDAVFRGKNGGMLQVVDAGSGETLTELELNSPPVFDGLIVVDGKVFLSTMDGHVVAMDAEAN